MTHAAWFRVGLLVLCLVVVGVVLGTEPRGAANRADLPLDDSYIHLQYARSLAAGHYMRYNPDDPPTTGGTSLLYPFLLAPAFRLNVAPAAIVWWARALGILGYLLLVQASFSLARALPPPAWRPPGTSSLAAGRADALALLAAGTVALSGAVVWATVSGMETTLAAALATAGLVAVYRRQPGWAAGLAVLTALMRPEGAALALPVALWIAGERGLGRRRLWLAGLIAAAVCVQPAINLAMTGSPSATGMVAKSWLFNVPFYPMDIARSILDTVIRIWSDLVVGLGRWIMAPLLAVLGLGYFVGQPLARWRAGRPLDGTWIAPAWLGLGTLMVAVLQSATWHYARYQLGLVVLLAIGGVHLAGHWLLKPTGSRRVVLAGMAAALLVFITLATARYAGASYHDSLRVTRGQVLAMADWLRANTPADARIGVHDAGAIRFGSDRAIYDAIGLTTPGAARAWRNGPGAVYEAMETSPQRPTWFATYPGVQAFAYFEGTDLFARLMGSYPVTDTATEVIVSAGEQRVYQADWSLLNSGDTIRQADMIDSTRQLRLVDRLDVADLASEDRHGYRWWNTARVADFASEVKQLAYRLAPQDQVMDGGRLVTGGEEWSIDAEPNTDLWIVLRTHARNRANLRVLVDGTPVGTWAYPPLPGEWLETVFLVPAEHVRTARPRIRVEAIGDTPGFRQHAPFYYWFFQGSAPAPVPPPSRPISATLGNQIGLIGYDLASDTVRPGETVTVTLYWRTAAALDDSDKVFVHVADPASGHVLAQSDGFARAGTRPTYTWQPGEVIVDERAVPIPPDAAAGEYALLAGLYAEDPPQQRLPVTQAGRPPGDSVRLGSIEVRP